MRSIVALKRCFYRARNSGLCRKTIGGSEGTTLFNNAKVFVLLP
jgi:hypothetical protein